MLKRQKINRIRQAGVSLIELMIGMVVGMIVIGGVLTIYIAVIESSNETIKQSRLNSEMSALMNIMTNDVRRAGFLELNIDQDTTTHVHDGTTHTFDNYTTAEIDAYVADGNPFSINGDTALSVRNLDATDWDDDGQDATPETGDGECILYSYDSDRNGAVSDAAVSNADSSQWTLDSDLAWVEDTTNTGPNELFGFKRDANSVWMRTSCQGTTDCTPTGAAGTAAHINHCDGGTWERVTDQNTVTITELTFDLSGSSCVNASEPDGVDSANDADTDVEDAGGADEYDCYVVTPKTDDNTAEIREVKITLKAQLVSDPIVNGTLVQTVRVRNNLIRKR